MQLLSASVGTFWIGLVIAAIVAICLIWGIFMLVLKPQQDEPTSGSNVIRMPRRDEIDRKHRKAGS